MDTSLGLVNLLLKTNHFFINTFLVGFGNDQIVVTTIRKKIVIIDIR